MAAASKPNFFNMQYTTTINELLTALRRAEATLEDVRTHWEPISHLNREAMKQAVAADHEAISAALKRDWQQFDIAVNPEDASKALIIHRLERLEHDSRGFGRICSDHETRLRELVTNINAVARKARIQDQLNNHGFANIEAAITALQPQPRKIPRKRNRNK
jgi:hypothetical protein